ncbi:MAG: hypothetical protein LBW85_12555 [Deltaproteobacteria bacterium]|jgi:hypothetical protein|nr:hypothetical protein [Deltaproteobacteria bacterium]
MSLLDRILPRFRAREFAGLFRERLRALRDAKGKASPPAGLAGLLARWGAAEAEAPRLARAFRARAILYAACGAAFSLPLVLGGSPALGLLPMLPGLLGCALDLWRLDMLRKGRWEPFRKYLLGLLRLSRG